MTYKKAIQIIQNMIIEDKRVYGDKPKQRNEALELAILSLQEFDKMKLICASEGIIVYKVKENKE